jgi:hypothetical protein
MDACATGVLWGVDQSLGIEIRTKSKKYRCIRTGGFLEIVTKTNS